MDEQQHYESSAKIRQYNITPNGQRGEDTAVDYLEGLGDDRAVFVHGMCA